jgi:large subunit ribosomal protein L15
MIELHTLKPESGSKKRRKRVGRGIGSGHGKTATRGMKGQKARDTIPPRFEGGQTPIHRRLPVRVGFRNVNRVEYAVINVSTLAERFQPNETVTPELLKERRIIRKLKGRRQSAGHRRNQHPAHGACARRQRKRTRQNRGGGRDRATHRKVRSPC